MEHTHVLWLMALVAVLLVVLFVLTARRGRRPFRGLTADQLCGATVQMTPPGTLAILSPQDLQSLVEILRKVTVYQEDNGYQASGCQMADFTLTMADGTEHTVSACTPWLIIDGVGYRTSHEPCLALRTLGSHVTGE